MKYTLPMVRLISTSAICLAATLTACGGDTGTDPITYPHYRLSTTVNSQPVFLRLDVMKTDLISAEEGSAPDTYDEFAGWRLFSDTTSNERLRTPIRALANYLSAEDYLDLEADGTARNFSMVGEFNRSDASWWLFERQPSGLCLIKNESLGSELALTIDTNSAPPYNITIEAIDQSLVQEWEVQGFLNPQYGFDTLCNGIPDSN